MSQFVFDPFDAAVQRDPFPFYRRLRDEFPIYQVPERGYWVLSRHEDVRAAFRDHETYSSGEGNAPEPGFQPGLIAKDPPRHTRLRRIVQSVFTRRALRDNWQPRVQAICERLVLEAVTRGDVDAFDALTLPLPVQIIAEMLGIPDQDLSRFKEWSDAMVAGLNEADPEAEQKAAIAFMELFQYFWGKVEERRGGSGDDLVTLICQAVEGDALSDKEAVHFCILLLIAGNETTTNLIGNTLIALGAHPEEELKLRAKPELIETAVEEMLRFAAPSQCFFRTSTRDVAWHGQDIPAGSRFMLSIGAANRDDRVFPDAERFQVERVMDADHATFGSGVHFCLGNMLARLEARTFFRELLTKTKSMRLTGEPTMLMSPIVRGPIALPMSFSAT